MKHLLTTLLLIVSLFSFCRCVPSNSPEGVTKRAMKALMKEDYDAYAETYNLSKSDKRIASVMVEDKLGSEISSKGGIKTHKIVKTEIDGDEAEVQVLITYKDNSSETSTLSFVKVDGVWLQIFE